MPSPGRAELAAAGVSEPALRAAYAACRELNARHGRTFFLATRLLPPARRPAVHALYGFARYADEVVDDLGDRSPAAVKAARLDVLEAQLLAAFAGRAVGQPVVAAVADTAARYRIDPDLFTAFLAAMRQDLTVTGYATFADLSGYMYGSAAVIGLQMLPVLGTVVPRAEAEEAAAALGVAFQLTNFLRDVGEDLDRGRVYLPADELAAFGVDRDLLAHCRRTGRTDPRVRAALAHLIDRTRAEYAHAEPGIAMLEPVSRACIGCAFTLYRAILDRIAATGHPVLHRRVTVPTATRLTVAAPAALRALAARTPWPGRGA